MTVRETVNATKERYGSDSLPALLAGATKLIAAKGKKVVTFDLKETPLDDPDLVKIVLGPTGNLRAPAIKKGKTWLIGFHEEAYDGAL